MLPGGHLRVFFVGAFLQGKQNIRGYFVWFTLSRFPPDCPSTTCAQKHNRKKKGKSMCNSIQPVVAVGIFLCTLNSLMHLLDGLVGVVKALAPELVAPIKQAVMMCDSTVIRLILCDSAAAWGLGNLLGPRQSAGIHVVIFLCSHFFRHLRKHFLILSCSPFSQSLFQRWNEVCQLASFDVPDIGKLTGSGI